MSESSNHQLDDDEIPLEAAQYENVAKYLDMCLKMMAKPYKEKLESKHATDLEASVVRLHTFLIEYLSLSVDAKILVKTVARYRKMIEKADKAMKTAAYRKEKLALQKRRTLALEKLLDAKTAEHGSPSFSDLAGLVQDE